VHREKVHPCALRGSVAEKREPKMSAPFHASPKTYARTQMLTGSVNILVHVQKFAITPSEAETIGAHFQQCGSNPVVCRSPAAHYSRNGRAAMTTKLTLRLAAVAALFPLLPAQLMLAACGRDGAAVITCTSATTTAIA